MKQICPGVRWVQLPGGTFVMGSNDFYPDEAPRHTARVAPFEMSATLVTNTQFAQFVGATGYRTVAERALRAQDFPHLSDAELAPGSLVFVPNQGPVDLSDWRQWWVWRPGASWTHPAGPTSDVMARGEHPVVQVAYEDALAFATWAGARLPTEAEHEYAACGGQEPAPYAWGSERDPGGALLANTWRGAFPYQNEGAAGWHGTSPVGTFPANGYGLFDLIGNVWEWTSDSYTPSHTSRAGHQGRTGLGQPAETGQRSTLGVAGPGGQTGCSCSPSGAGPGVGTPELGVPAQEASLAGGAQGVGAPQMPPVRRVLKGGSHLCAPEYCLRYRPAARSPQDEDSATTHIGFRLARDANLG